MAEYIAYLLHLDEQTGQLPRPRRTLDQALGLLAQPGQAALSDVEVSDWLAERRVKK